MRKTRVVQSKVIQAVKLWLSLSEQRVTDRHEYGCDRLAGDVA